MSEEQFKGLDDVMKKHAPSTARELKPLSLPKQSSNWIKGLALAATAMIVVTIFHNSQVNTRTESLLALNETMEWDATADELPEDVAEDMDYLSSL